MKVKGSLYWIYSFTSGCKGKMLVAILLAVIGVLCGMAPYFALAGILSGLIQNTLTAERIFCYVGIAVLGETLKMLFNTVSSLKAHRVAYHILGNIRCKLAEKMMRVPMGVMVDTPSGKLKAMVVDTVDKLEQPLAHMLPEIAIITGLLYFATGECTWVIIVTFAVAGILGEAARKVLGYKSFKGIALAGGFTAFGFIGSPLPMWLFQDAYMKSIEEMGMGVEYVEGLQSMISAGSFIGMLAVAFVGGLIGTLVGRLMLKKHFEKAGIV